MNKYEYNKEDTYEEHFIKCFMQKIDPELISNTEEIELTNFLSRLCSLIVQSSQIKYRKKLRDDWWKYKDLI